MKPIESFQGEHRFLSNFWPIDPATLHGYPTVEHFYQAMKSNDPATREMVKKASTPGQAKRAGRKVKIHPRFEALKLQIMEYAVDRKFRFNPDLRDRLIATGDSEIIEGNHWGDTFWGVCNGTGQNHLGRILMKVRHRLTLHQQGDQA